MRRLLIPLALAIVMLAGSLAGSLPHASAHLGPEEAVPAPGETVDSVTTVRLRFPLDLEPGADHKLLLSDLEGNLFEMGPTTQVNSTTIEARLIEELPGPGYYIVRYTAWESRETGELDSFSDGGYEFIYDPSGELGSGDDDGVGSAVLIGVLIGFPLVLAGGWVFLRSRSPG